MSTKMSPSFALALAFAVAVVTADSHEDDDPMLVHSEEHLAHHMRDMHLPPGDGNSGSSHQSEQQEYYYFKLHDLDNNEKLDGLELAKSLFDHAAKEGQSAQSDHQLEQTVNRLLQDEDTNGDGYVDYAEFVAAQRRRKA